MNDWIFKTRTKGDVRIEWGLDEMIAYTMEETPREIGRIEFQEVDCPTSPYLLVMSMFLEGPEHSKEYLNEGIGREMVRNATNYLPVVFRRHDGNRRDDGSHLTGSGPGFAERMVVEGLATWDD